MALGLFEQGDDVDGAERALHAVGFHPSLCRDAAVWAHNRHREALIAATAPPGAA